MTNELTLHPDDADLVRLMDGALSGADRASLDSHVTACVDCARRRAILVRRSQRVSQLLRLVDAPAPATPLRVTLKPAGASPTWWRIAAVVTVAIAAAAVPPVRAWIAEAARSVWAAATGTTAPRPVPDRTGVAFIPAGSVLTIRMPAQGVASITLEVVDSARVTMVEKSGRPLPRVTVLPDELRVDQGTDSTASYLVRVPIRLEAVRIVIDDRLVQVFRPSVPGERRTFRTR